MNIGDKVRFLNSIGGGKITGFEGKDIVLVCDDDGFEVPTLRKEVVVIETDNYKLAKKVTKNKEVAAESLDAPTSIKAILSRHHNEDETETEADLADKEITFQARPLERRGADALNLHLGFMPINRQQLNTTRFEAYLVNDSNLYVRFILLTQQATQYVVRHEGLIAPNQKIFLEEFGHDDLPEIERLTLQLLAYKADKAFPLKAPLNVTLRIDGTKFYKLHTFQSSDFFNDAALVYDLVCDDKPAQSVVYNAEEVETAMLTPKEEHRRPTAARAQQHETKGRDRNTIVEIDLHASSLLESTAGMEPRDILMVQIKAFHETMKQYTKDRGRRIVFIHGKGEGILRQEILKELKRYYSHCTHQDASFREYGFGATMVTIR